MRFAAAEATKAGVSNRMLLTLGSPRESIFKNRAVDSVTVPGAEGYFTLTHNHSLIAEARGDHGPH